MKKASIAGIIALSIIAAQADTVIINFGDAGGAAGAAKDIESLGAGLNATNYVGFTDVVADNYTMVYDLSSLNVGAAFMEVTMTAASANTNGPAILSSAGRFGAAVEDGVGNDNWIDVGETLTLNFVLRDSLGADVTSSVDTFNFTGYAVRGRDNVDDGTPVTIDIGGESLTPTAMGLHNQTGFANSLSDSSYQLVASRSGQDNILSLTQMQFEVIPEPATLGLLGFVGGSLLFIRRRFMM